MKTILAGFRAISYTFTKAVLIIKPCDHYNGSTCDVLSSHLYFIRQRLEVVSPLVAQSQTGAAEEEGGTGGKGVGKVRAEMWRDARCERRTKMLGAIRGVGLLSL